MSQRALDALSKVIDPEIRKPITDLGMVGDISETGDSVEVDIKLTIVGCPAANKIENDVRAALGAVYKDTKVNMLTMTAEELQALKEKLRAGKPSRHNFFADPKSLTQVILVSSGKGGVGKSTLSANLAVALAQQNFQVGILDADIYGYSIPAQLGISQKPTKVDEFIMPPTAHDVRVISIGMFTDDNSAIAWRGPMLHRAIEQFLTDVYWGALDFLVVDLPPGTGDVAISIGQQLPNASVLVVTTPQQVAAQVAQRSGAIGIQAGHRIIGVVENMSYLVTPNGPVYPFGSGGGQTTADQLSKLAGYEVPLISQIPLDEALAQASDAGTPLVIASEQSPAKQAIVGLAAEIAKLPRGLSGKALGLKPV